MSVGVVWREETSAATRNLWLGGLGALGAVFVVLCRPGTTGGDGNRVAAFWLGVLLLVVALVGGVGGGRSSVTVDGRRREIVSERTSVFGTRVVVVPFGDVESVSVQTVAGHNGTPAWHVVLRRRDGTRVPLYVGFFTGQFSRAAMETRRRRIEAAVESARS